MKLRLVLACDPGFKAAARYTLASMLGMTGLPFEVSAAPGEGPDKRVIMFYGPEGACPPEADVSIVAGSERPSSGELPVQVVGDSVQISADVVAAAFSLLTHFAGNDHTLGEPLVNRYAWRLGELVLEAAWRKGLPCLQVLPWPKGHRHAVVLSHDVDQTELDNPANGLRVLRLAIKTREWRGFPRGLFYMVQGLWGRLAHRGMDPAWQFERIMALEQEHGFRSSFYFVPLATSAGRDPAYDIDDSRMRAIIRQLCDGGWEIGVHGSYHSYRNAGQLRREREKLEAVLGGAAAGIRQHYLRFAGNETFSAQEQAGYSYDTSLGYTRTTGFRAGIAAPFHPFDTKRMEPLALLELPLVVMDGVLFWYLGCDVRRAVEHTVEMVNLAREYGGLSVLLWHQRAGDEQRYPGWWQAYEQVVRYLHHQADAWVVTADQVARWWLARERLQMETARDKDGHWYWSCHAPQSLEGLVLGVRAAGNLRIAVRGAEAEIETGERGEMLVRLEQLSAGQDFDVVVST